MPITAKWLVGLVTLLLLTNIGIPSRTETTYSHYEMFTPGRLVYAFQDWSSVEESVETLSTSMKVNCPKHQVTEYYWGIQFVFENGSIGWAGMTSSCMGLGGNGFVFTICDAISAEAHPEGYLSKNIEPGNGLSCILPYDWNNGMTYQLNITKNPSISTQKGIVWSLSVEEMDTNQIFQVGDIVTNPDWDTFYNWSAYFVEYFGPIMDCNVMPRGSITFDALQIHQNKKLPISDVYIVDACENQTEIQPQKEDKLYIKTGSKY
ncbi:MAG: hypothetical protein PHI40_00620 [Caldisericia bacterium]|nr:hypothetical protein [Caldisericia bacterium]MDD4613902.1 hypothetical protein [Caldisericia bacterium]